MAINYDFIAYCSKISSTDWIIGMKATHGEVPLDIVIPDEQTPPEDPNAPEIVGVLTTEGLERESTDGFELYRYLRQLNPKKSDAFGYNEVVIRNIHSRLRALRVDEELRVQITYTERKEPYRSFSYNIKLLGTFQNSDAEMSTDAADEIDTTDTPVTATTDTPVQNTLFQETRSTDSDSGQSPYKTTNTLEKVIAFTQNLQQELKQTKRDLAVTVDRIEQLENEWQNFREMQELIQEVLDRLTRLETMDSRLQYLEADRHQLQNLQELLRKFFVALNQQTKVLLQDPDDQTPTQ
ncbi:hypothetical protein C6503_09415 [Candidatus Poribacteria bacterium]|nr:MAG: hypothetical protein C6503_09415 [Candidatus Poribacteria bacterium]